MLQTVDMNLNGITELQIFANIWNITQPVTFDLSGSDGATKEPAINGAAGNAGNNGMDGGNFFGLANETINGEYLTVKSNGGNGGNGQDGATSADVFVLLNAEDDSGDNGWFSNGDLHSYYKKYFDDRGYVSEISDIDDYTSLYAVFVQEKKASFNIRLHPRKCCGSTGIGGEGGLGGRSGKLLFKHIGKTKSQSTPNFTARDGSAGKSGKDGKTCESFALDVRIDAELKKVVFVVLPLHHSFSSHFTVLNHTSSSKCSPVYARSNETTASEPRDIEIDLSVIRYKQFLLKNLQNASLATGVQEMYKAIDKSPKIEYSLKALALEACELEKNYIEMKKPRKLYPMYRRLLHRIENAKLNGQNEDDERAQLQSILHDRSFIFPEDLHLITTLKPKDVAKYIKFRYEDSAIENVSDVELRNSLNKLRFQITGSVILDDYHNVVNVFRLAYFPFAAEYLENYILPTSTTDYDNLDDIYFGAHNKLDSLIESIDHIELINSPIMMKLNYIDDTDPTNALFIWNNSDIREQVRELFEGKQIALFADVKHATKKFNAMKFNSIDFVFRSSNQSIDHELNGILESFHFKLIHTGRSTFRCNSNFYEMTHHPIPIQYSFRKDENRHPTGYSGTYEMLRNSRARLSPFTTWKMQIVETFEGTRVARNISDLARFGQLDIDIELHGTGKFIEENVPSCENENLPRFYTQIPN